MNSDPGRWKRVRALLEEALERRGDERERFVRERSDGDESLVSEVMRLARQEDGLGSYLEPPTDAFAGVAAANQEPLDGQRVGAWQLQRTIGSGGMGTVYLAHRADGDFDRRVAIKVIRRGMDSDEMIRRFRRERKLLAQFDHINIARLLDGGVTDKGTPYIVMEFVEGEPIDAYCDKRRLSVDARLSLFLKVCSAVHHAHQRLVIHRDLKPSNILVTRDGEPKLLDFGLAKMLSDDSDLSLTRTGERALTPAYASPEQVRGDVMTTTSDVYSLGVVLYRLLTGQSPYGLTSSTFFDEVGRAICEVEPKPPSDNVEDAAAAAREGSAKKLRRRLDGDLDTIVMKALRKEPARRYLSAEQLHDDIERHLRGLPVIAQRDSLLYRTSKFVRRHRASVALVAVVAIALVVGLIVSSRLWVLARQRYDQVIRLADVHRVQQLAQRSDELWPPQESNRAAMLDWISVAEQVVQRKQRHASRREALEATSERSTEEAWELEVLTGLLAGIGELEATEPRIGSLVEMRAREQFAREVEPRTISSPSAQAMWNTAIADIASSTAYHGLQLAPQLGLLPLGRNAITGLWEFWHVQTGSEPKPDERGGWRVDDDSGIVLVLLPGGTFEMGSPADEVGRELPEGPVHQVTLDPFFISKFELTQGQWLRVAGDNPSHFKPGVKFADEVFTLSDPVETVSWVDCARWHRRTNLHFPSEAQWEYAARAGTRTAWWTGNDRESLRGAANLADQSAAHYSQDWAEINDWPELDDGFGLLAPVGRFRANAFGLYDVHGNVTEWCHDVFGDYREPPQPGDGHRTKGYADGEPVRGGSMSGSANLLRAARREFLPPGTLAVQIGVRPIRVVER